MCLEAQEFGKSTERNVRKTYGMCLQIPPMGKETKTDECNDGPTSSGS